MAPPRELTAPGDNAPCKPLAASDRKARRLEWTAAAIACLVVSLMIGALLWEAAFGARLPPDLVVTLQAPVDVTGGRRLQFRVENRGGRAASAIGVALRLPDDRTDFARRLTIDYVPARSEVTGGFFVAGGAQTAGAVAVVEGYVDP